MEPALLEHRPPDARPLELHWYAPQKPGWCLTTKLPMRDAAGALSRERYDNFVKLQLEIRYLREAGKKVAWQERKKSDGVAHRVFNNRG